MFYIGLLIVRIFFAYFRKVRMSHFFSPNWHFSTAILISVVYFYYLFLLGFVTSTVWLPTEWHHLCVQTAVERDGVVGFKQFCTIFPPHIWRLCDPKIFKNAA